MPGDSPVALPLTHPPLTGAAVEVGYHGALSRNDTQRPVAPSTR
jgi:hypothetical protein